MPFWLGWTKFISNPGLWLSRCRIDHGTVHRQQRQRDHEENRQRFHRGPFLPAAAAGFG